MIALGPKSAVALGCALLGVGLGMGARAVSSQAQTVEPTGTPVAQPERGIRERTQPGTWKRGTVGNFTTVRDRPAARAQSVIDRAERRAYDGAPPVMPHSALFGDGTKVCLDCHAEGMKIGKRVAHPMSHPPLTNCVQCHVVSSNRMFEPKSEPVTSFEGRPSAGAGPRWTDLAPPQIPHDTAMRTHCLSCHGEFGYPGIRTEHPMRANCVQCHVTATKSRR